MKTKHEDFVRFNKVLMIYMDGTSI